MSTIQAVLLGLVQGLTEFLPVSSSAHLAAAQALLGVQAPAAGVAIALHCGTLLAILIVFWQDLWAVALDGLRGGLGILRGKSMGTIAQTAPLWPTAVAIVIGSVPAGLAGLLLGEKVELLFSNVVASGALLFVTGLLLLSSRWSPAPRTDRVDARRGFVIGMAQAAALLPGISRSGATIVTGCLLGVERRAAGRFSFLLAVPAMVGAALWELHRASAAPQAAAGQDELIRMGALAAGVLVSTLVGTVCLLFLLRVVERGRLHWFAAYCLPAGAAMVLGGLIV
jgi:undecaprenyl-diphosphatase